MDCKYDVDVYELPFLTYSDIFPMESGIYFLFAEKYGELLYVGQSKKLRHRIAAHEKVFEDLYLYTHRLDRYIMGYKAIEVSVKELDKTEAFFINKYHPPMNSDNNNVANRVSYRMWVRDRIVEFDKMQKVKEMQRNNLVST